MKKNPFLLKNILIYLFVIAVFLVIPLLGNRAVLVYSESLQPKNYVVIDAGHGGIDSGAISCTGAYESHINLQIALKLQDLMHFLGIRTIMIRETDCSIHVEGDTIAAKKVSDIRERIRIVNTTPNALLVSIHQNNFQDARYSGAQVFYNSLSNSKILAENLQASFRNNLDAKNKRSTKKISGVYLMERINCPGVLIECGFLSNPTEEIKLQDSKYQNAICCIIACTISQYLNT